MRDLALVGFLVTLCALALKRPFLFTCAYAYVDIVSPQRLSYFLLNSIPLSMIMAALAVAGWLIADDKKQFALGPRQLMMLALLGYAGFTTLHADLPLEAMSKWEWAWKAMAFAIFLPWTLHSRLRIETLLLFMTLAAGAIVIVGGIKTMMSGGGYGSLNLMVDNNSGLYEGSIISMFAIALIPIILWFTRFGTLFPPDWRVKAFGFALVFACLLMPIGTEARTGLICVGVLGLLMLRDVKRRLLYIGGAFLLALAAIPFLPASFTERMGTISGYQADQSANTRLAVWQWTMDYVQRQPLGGGFEAYRQNRIQVQTVDVIETGEVAIVRARMEADEGRAWHSAYFEMLGEQGWPGLFLFVLIHVTGLVRMEIIRRRYRSRADGLEWVAPLATALQHFQIVYLVGGLFVAVAWQPFMWMAIGAQLGLDRWVVRHQRATRTPRRIEAPAPAMA
ncbi:MAG: DUF5935 domain-containing protein [Sphingosinicella sp.]